MRYMFKLQRNIFMYNHLLTVSDGKKEYKAIIESMPTKQESMAIWLEDFSLTERLKATEDLNLEVSFNAGHNCKVDSKG